MNEIQGTVSLCAMVVIAGYIFRDASLNNLSLICLYGRVVLTYLQRIWLQ